MRSGQQKCGYADGRLKTILMSCFLGVGVFLFSHACLARSISLPHNEDFNNPNSIDDLRWQTMGGSVIWEANGGWQGSGGVRITPTLTGQGYAALGNFGNFGLQNRLNVRYLMYVGRTFFQQASFGKIIVIHRLNQQSWMRPMVMSNGRYYTDNVLYNFFTVSQGVANIGSPISDGSSINPNNYFTIGTDGSNTEMWISYEFEVDLTARRMNMYIHSEDGQYNEVHATLDMTGLESNPTNNPITEIACIGCFWPAPGEEPPFVLPPFGPETHVRIDELRIDNRYIGPPAGFQNNPAPAPINDLRITVPAAP